MSNYLNLDKSQKIEKFLVFLGITKEKLVIFIVFYET